jgi:hypothetical protein
MTNNKWKTAETRFWWFFNIFIGFWIVFGFISFLYSLIRYETFNYNALILSFSMLVLLYSYKDKTRRSESQEE